MVHKTTSNKIENKILKEEKGIDIPVISAEDRKKIQTLKIPHAWHNGRSSVGEEEITKLQHAFSVGATISEAAAYAGINRKTVQRHMNQSEDFKEWVETLMAKPLLKAKHTVVAHLDDPVIAFRYLERRAPKEFGKDRSDDDGKIEAEPLVIYMPQKRKKPQQKKEGS